MPYGSNITEPIPVTIGNPTNNQLYAGTGVAYDISIGGQPFFLLNDDNNPYRRAIRPVIMHNWLKIFLTSLGCNYIEFNVI